jgi:hypothetical protein
MDIKTHTLCCAHRHEGTKANNWREVEKFVVGWEKANKRLKCLPSSVVFDQHSKLSLLFAVPAMIETSPTQLVFC